VFLCLVSAHFEVLAAPKEPPDISKLADGVYAQIVAPENVAAVSNSGIVVLDGGVLVFDTHFTPDAGQLLLAGIQSLTPKPVRFLVLSHFHPDHTHGNQVFPNAPLIIGNTNSRRDMLQQDIPSLSRVLAVTRDQLERARKEVLTETEPKVQERMRAAINNRQALVDALSRLKILPPLVTVDDELSILDPAREIRLLCLGFGHTEGDLVMFLPAEKIVFTGDLFFYEGIPNTQDGNILDWMKTLEELTKLDADRFVPGHGPVGTKQDVKLFLGYFEDLKALVEPAVTRGDTIEQVLETPVPSKYAAYRFQNLFRPNLEKMYRELKARQLAETAQAKPVPGR
jgi:glyoxylase-like metal-dependent hydrolase (beta-lactamase superfamily II)